MPIQIYWNFLPSKNENFQIKKFWYFSHFCSKHRLWVLVRTASPRRFKRVPTIHVLSRNKKNNVYPSKPQFYYIKVGFTGSQLYRHVFVMSFFMRWKYILCHADHFFGEEMKVRRKGHRHDTQAPGKSKIHNGMAKQLNPRNEQINGRSNRNIALAWSTI